MWWARAISTSLYLVYSKTTLHIHSVHKCHTWWQCQFNWNKSTRSALLPNIHLIFHLPNWPSSLVNLTKRYSLNIIQIPNLWYFMWISLRIMWTILTIDFCFTFHSDPSSTMYLAYIIREKGHFVTCRICHSDYESIQHSSIYSKNSTKVNRNKHNIKKLAIFHLYHEI